MAIAIAHPFDCAKSPIAEGVRVVRHARIVCAAHVTQTARFVVAIAYLCAPVIGDALQFSRQIVVVIRQNVSVIQLGESARL